MGNSMVRILHHTVRCLFVASISFAQLEPSQNLQGIQNVDYARAAYGAYNPYYPGKVPIFLFAYWLSSIEKTVRAVLAAKQSIINYV